MKRKYTGKGTDYLAPLPADSFYLFFFDFFVFFWLFSDSWGGNVVPSRFMRKIICRLRLNEVSRQWRRRPAPSPSASCSYIFCCPTACPLHGEAGCRPASKQSCRQGTFPPRGFCGCLVDLTNVDHQTNILLSVHYHRTNQQLYFYQLLYQSLPVV